VVTLRSILKQKRQLREESIEEALANLREATELYLEEFPLTLTEGSLLTTFQIARSQH
jgi:hypothetical protein